ncbi:MAG: hypothetical protein EA351_11855 [Gemmatimonadales bacterium]|nr:MAG: hypothetical protein EA351_11855 [Gemmatimonadales bacterium]
MLRSTAVLASFVILLVVGGPSPAHAQDAPPGATLTGISLDTLDLTTPEGRRALLRRRPFVPQATPPYTGDRTIFYGVRASQVTEGSQVLLVPPSEVPTLSPATFQAASWLVHPDAPTESLGEVRYFSGGQDVRLGRSTVLPYDDVRLSLDPGVSVQPGDQLLAVRESRTIENVGQVMIPTGVLEVQRVDASGAVARLVRDYSKVELGNQIVPMRTFPLEAGVYPGDTPSRFSARVLAFEERKELYLPGDRFFIDAGAADGLAVGDEFSAMAGAADGWEGADAGDFQVVGLRDGTATLRIVQSRLPSVIRPGMTVVLTRAMP